MEMKWTDYAVGSYVCYFTPVHVGVVSNNNEMGYHGRVVEINNNSMKIEVTLENDAKVIVEVCKETVESLEHNNLINVINDPTIVQ